MMRKHECAMRTCRALGLAAFFLIVTAACTDHPSTPTDPDQEFGIGVNVDELSYFGTEVPFVNLFKLAAPWFTQCDALLDPLCQARRFAKDNATSWDTREQAKLDLDADGYPRRLPDPKRRVEDGINFSFVATLVPTGLSKVNNSGRFVVLYDGEGSLEYGRGAARDVTSSRPGRDVLTVVTDGNQAWFQLAIRATDPQRVGNHVRNIRVLPVGGMCDTDATRYCDVVVSGALDCQGTGRCVDFEALHPTHPYDPRFLNNLKPFAAIRFMGFQNINNSMITSWVQRTLPGRATWVSAHGDGVPIEIMANLGNQLGADIWVNMPTGADDDYVRRFAAPIKAHLHRSHRVYVEYSNEVWNSSFPAGAWVEQQAESLWSGGSETPFDKRLQWFGMRTAQICDIWEDVWGDDAARVICVMGAQAANPWTALQALDCPRWAAENGGVPCYRHHVDALAIAPYFGFYIGSSEHAGAIRFWTTQSDGGLGNLFAEIFQGGQFPDSPSGGALRQARAFIDQSAVVARTRGLSLVGYEGGQHLVGIGNAAQDSAIAALFVAANRDPRMGAAYRVHLADWQQAGGGLYNLWNSVSSYSGWGSWGLLEYRGQATAPKYDAVLEYLHGSQNRDP